MGNKVPREGLKDKEVRGFMDCLSKATVPQVKRMIFAANLELKKRKRNDG